MGFLMFRSTSLKGTGASIKNTPKIEEDTMTAAQTMETMMPVTLLRRSLFLMDIRLLASG